MAGEGVDGSTRLCKGQAALADADVEKCAAAVLKAQSALADLVSGRAATEGVLVCAPGHGPGDEGVTGSVSLVTSQGVGIAQARGVGTPTGEGEEGGLDDTEQQVPQSVRLDNNSRRVGWLLELPATCSHSAPACPCIPHTQTHPVRIRMHHHSRHTLTDPLNCMICVCLAILQDGLKFKDFAPLRLQQFASDKQVFVPSFNLAVDEYFSRWEVQRAVQEASQSLTAAGKKLEKIRRDHEVRLAALWEQQLADRRRAAALQLYMEKVDAAITTVRDALAEGLAWYVKRCDVGAEKRGGRKWGGQGIA